MDTSALVDEWIGDGKKLVEALGRQGFPFEAGAWLKPSEKNRWYFYIVTSLVKDDTGDAYEKLLRVLNAMPRPFLIGPLNVKVIGPDNPIAKSIRTMHGFSGRSVPIRMSGRLLGDLSVDEAYFYPQPANGSQS